MGTTKWLKTKPYDIYLETLDGQGNVVDADNTPEVEVYYVTATGTSTFTVLAKTPMKKRNGGTIGQYFYQWDLPNVGNIASIPYDRVLNVLTHSTIDGIDTLACEQIVLEKCQVRHMFTRQYVNKTVTPHTFTIYDEDGITPLKVFEIKNDCNFDERAV